MKVLVSLRAITPGSWRMKLLVTAEVARVPGWRTAGPENVFIVAFTVLWVLFWVLSPCFHTSGNSGSREEK